MIKVENNKASRERLPIFLSGLSYESLIDLSWTDPSLGVSHLGWWPEEYQVENLKEFELYGEEILTVDNERKVVIVTREILPMTELQKEQYIIERVESEKQKYIDLTQKYLDDFARTRGYDSILSACTYAASSVEKFRTEGLYCVNLRDATWTKLYDILQEVLAGTRPLPTHFEDVLKDLPKLEWPDEDPFYSVS